MASITYNNIFDAVTDNQEASSELQTRADLMIVIRDIVIDNGWKQADAADKLGFRFKPNYKNKQLTMEVQAA